MNHDDQELNYMTGEMSGSEQMAFEQSLTTSAKELKAVFSSLKTLNESIPEAQISFERVRNAIDAAPKTAAPLWTRWLIWASPVAAMGAIVIVMATRSNAPVAIPVSNPTSVAHVDPPKPITQPDIAVRPEAKVLVEVPTVVAKVNAEPATRIRRPLRRTRPATLASLAAPPPSAGAGLNKASAAGRGQAITKVDAPESLPSNESQPVVMEPEPVVVVSPTQSAHSGANAAVEVGKQTDDVLGG